MAFVIAISLTAGLYDMDSNAHFNYQKEILKVSPLLMQIMQGAVFIAWMLKPIFGYICDELITKLGKSKYLIVCTGLTKMTIYMLLSSFDKLPIGVYYFGAFSLQVMSVMENITMEYILVLSTKKENEENQDSRANHMPIYFGCRATGSIVGSFFSGRITDAWSVYTTFRLCAAFPLISIIFAVLYGEAKKDIDPDEHVTFADQMRAIKQLIMRDQALKLIMIVCLINLTPTFDPTTRFYFMDVKGYSNPDLSNFDTFAAFMYVVGLLLYYSFSKKVEPVTFFTITNFVLLGANLSFLLMVRDIIKQWGFNEKIFAGASIGIQQLAAQLNSMPIFGIWCSICPKNLEATSITLITGVMNLASISAGYLGAAVVAFAAINRKDYSGMWIPIVCQSSYLFVVSIGIIIAKFPVPKPDHVLAAQNEQEPIVTISKMNEEPLID